MVQFSSVTQSCPTFCDPMNRSTPGLPVHHQLPEFTLRVTLVPMEINTINGENNSPELQLVLDREEKNGNMIL